ncbi:MAG: DUF3540 domain-containing protein [Polyangiaceae bacterium]
MNEVKSSELATRSGATAVVVDTSNEERIEVRDAARRLVFELDLVRNKAILTMPEGDLSVRAPKGNLELSAGGAVRVHAGRAVELESGQGSERARLELRSAAAKLTADALSLTAATAELALDHVAHAGTTLVARVADVTLEATRLETVAVRLFERARAAFRRVEDLHQIKAGRTRTIVEGAHVVRAGHTSIESREETKIDGSEILLG